MEILFKNLARSQRKNFVAENLPSLLRVNLSGQAQWIGAGEMVALLMKRKVASKRGVTLVLSALYGMNKSPVAIKSYLRRCRERFEQLPTELNPTQFVMLRSVLLHGFLPTMEAASEPCAPPLTIESHESKGRKKIDPRDHYKAPKSAYRV